MPGKKGIDTQEERSFFDYRPNIGYVPPDTTTPDPFVSPLETTEDPTQLLSTEKAFIDDIRAADEKIATLRTLLSDQQMLLAIPVDSEDDPDVAEAVQYFIDLGLVEKQGNTQSKPVISFDLYNAAYDAVKEGGVYRSFGGDPYASSIGDANKLSKQISAWDNNRTLELVAYKILSIVLDFVGKKVIPGGIFKPLKNKFISWAKAALKHALYNTPPEPTLGDGSSAEDEVPLGTDGAYGKIKSFTPPSTPKSIVPVEGVGYGSVILSFIHKKAAEGATPGANPSSFYIKPMLDYASDTHVATKLAVQISANSSYQPNNTYGKPLSLLTDSDLSRYEGYIKTSGLGEYDALLGDAKTTKSIDSSIVFQAMSNYGYGKFNSLLDNMEATLRYWYQSPEVLCCLIKVLGAAGKVDKSLLYSIRFILLNLISSETAKSAYVFDSLSDLLNSLVLTLMAKVASVIDSLSVHINARISKLISSLTSDPVSSNCSPLDELLATLAGGLTDLDIELSTHLSSLIGELGIRDAKLKRTTGNVERKARYERLLKIVDAIISAVEVGDLCSDDPNAISSTQPPSPTAEEVEQFLTIGLLPVFEDARKGRSYIMAKYGRDPVTGKSIAAAQVSSVSSTTIDKIRQDLDKCQKRVTPDALTNMIKSMRDRGVL